MILIYQNKMITQAVIHPMGLLKTRKNRKILVLTRELKLDEYRNRIANLLRIVEQL